MRELLLIGKIIKRDWWIIILSVLAAVIVSLMVTYYATPQYRADVRFVISPTSSAIDDPKSSLDAINALDSRNRIIIATYTEILNSRFILEESAKRLSIDLSILNDYEFATVILPSSNVLQLTVTGPSSQNVMIFANSVGEQAINHAENIYPLYRINLLEPATAPKNSFSPNITRNITFAVLISFVLGIILVIVYELISPSEAVKQILRISDEPQTEATASISESYERKVNMSEPAYGSD